MQLQDVSVQRLERAFARWEDLARHLADDAFEAKLSARSNTVGQQLWCVVGARESYTRALAAGEWAGFACSLTGDDIKSSAGVLAGLERSAGAFREVAGKLEWTEARFNLLLDLLEHEAQHQGQLTRYVYALRLSFPDSWKQRWALE